MWGLAGDGGTGSPSAVPQALQVGRDQVELGLAGLDGGHSLDAADGSGQHGERSRAEIAADSRRRRRTMTRLALGRVELLFVGRPLILGNRWRSGERADRQDSGTHRDQRLRHGSGTTAGVVHSFDTALTEADGPALAGVSAETMGP